MTVFDALEATASLAELSAVQPDGLLLALAATPGVVPDSIVIRPRPRPGRHGLHVATWTQDARTLTVEGHTLDVALRRALRRSEQVSAKAGAK